MGKITPETSLSQTEITLAAVRDEALKSLIKDGVASTYTSEAHRTAKGLEVTTTNARSNAASTMIVDGSASGEHRTVDLGGIHFDTQVKGDFTITHLNGKSPAKVEKDHFELTGSDMDEWWHRPDKFNVSFNRSDAAGNSFQRYEPAISEEQTSNGRPVLDANGQPVRIARSAGNDANCGLENIYNPGNKRMECDYIVHDKTLGDLSYNQTREKDPAGWYYRSVVRDMKGQVLGIVVQSFDLDQNGDITSVHTSARKPMATKK